MSTKKPRINITFEEKTVKLIALLARQEQKSVSGLSRELILEALDRREDAVLSAIADTRDTKKAKKTSHAHAWK